MGSIHVKNNPNETRILLGNSVCPNWKMLLSEKDKEEREGETCLHKMKFDSFDVLEFEFEDGKTSICIEYSRQIFVVYAVHLI